MRKQTKLAVGLSAAALLAIGATMTSFAARGWVAEGDQWYYYDSNGDYVTDKWKSYNGNWFYLGDEGYMLTNELIEDSNNYYFVDANGAMVKNAWIPVPADDSEDQDVEYRWYYFGSNGKAYKANAKKTINGKKYGFDEEGKMLFGYALCDDDAKSYELLNENDDAILSCNRYYGTNEDGAMYTGWLLYAEALDATGYDDQYYWFNFKSNGIKRANTTAKINGKQYTFDEWGVMLHGWTDATIGDYATYGNFSNEDDGSLQKSRWIWSDTENKNIGGDGDNHWWYVDKHGFRTMDQIKKINGKYYAFDEDGVMQWGLVYLTEDSVKAKGVTVDVNEEGKPAAYDPEDLKASDIMDGNENLFFFSNDEEKDGSMKTGANIKIELWDDTYTFGFDKNTGKAYHGVKNNKLYNCGILLTAGDNKYAIKSVGGESYLVSSNGTVMKVSSRTYKDADDRYWCVAKDGFYWADSAAAAKLCSDGAEDKNGNVCHLWTE